MYLIVLIAPDEELAHGTVWPYFCSLPPFPPPPLPLPSFLQIHTIKFTNPSNLCVKFKIKQKFCLVRYHHFKLLSTYVIERQTHSIGTVRPNMTQVVFYPCPKMNKASCSDTGTYRMAPTLDKRNRCIIPNFIIPNGHFS